MTATTSNEMGAGRLVTAFVASDPATGPPGDIMFARDAAQAGGLRPKLRRDIGAALAAGERAIAGVMRKLLDAHARRRTVRELRRLGASRLVDIGIEPDRIEQVVDAMMTARRNGMAMRGERSEPRSG